MGSATVTQPEVCGEQSLLTGLAAKMARSKAITTERLQSNKNLGEAVTNLRLFIEVDGKELADFDVLHVPRVGERVWLKSLDWSGTVIVDDVEHRFDRSRADGYGTQDVVIKCRYAE